MVHNFGAQSWPVENSDIGQQQGPWACGFYALNGIACCSSDQGEWMEQAQLDTVKQLIALDLVHQCIVDTTTEIGLLTQNAEDVIMPTRPSPSPEAEAPVSGTLSEGSQQQQESTPGAPIQDEPLATLPRPSRQTKDLTTNMRVQWNCTGMLEQKSDSSRWRTPRRQPIQPPVEQTGWLPLPGVITMHQHAHLISRKT